MQHRTSRASPWGCLVTWCEFIHVQTCRSCNISRLRFATWWGHKVIIASHPTLGVLSLLIGEVHHYSYEVAHVQVIINGCLKHCFE